MRSSWGELVRFSNLKVSLGSEVQIVFEVGGRLEAETIMGSD